MLIESLTKALTEMVERERSRYENSRPARAYFEKNNAAALAALASAQEYYANTRLITATSPDGVEELKAVAAFLKTFAVYTVEDDEGSIRLSMHGKLIACWGDHTDEGIAMLKFEAARTALASAQRAKARGLRRAFINRLKIINSLDWDEVESFDVEQWKRFRDDPFGFLMKASDDEAAAVLDAMGRRLVR